MNIPLAAVLAFIGLFITARFQRIHWLRSTQEEIRVRETKEASDLVKDIATTFDKRIAAQRLLLLNLGSQDEQKFRDYYLESIKEYMHRYNEIRYRLHFYLDYNEVLSFERNLNDRVVFNGAKIAKFSGGKRELQDIDREALNGELSVISAHVFRYCKNISGKISRGEFGTLRKLANWRDPQNEFVTISFLVRRLLNL